MCDTLFQVDYKSRSVCRGLVANYSRCKPSDANPFDGGVSFDNIVIAFITIFQVVYLCVTSDLSLDFYFVKSVSIEGWNEIMYTVQDASLFWVWPYFIFLIILVPFGSTNLSFTVVALQIPETKRRIVEEIVCIRNG